MNTATLSVKGQIVIPKHLRQSAQLVVGDELSIVYQDGEIRLRPLATKKHSALDQVAGCLARPQQAQVSEADIQAEIKARLKARSAA